MKNKILAVIFGVASSAACAQQDNTQLMMKDTLCQNVAGMAALGYASRPTHHHYELQQVIHLDDGDFLAPVKIWAFNFGRDVAPSDADARKIAYGKCWDKADRAALHAKQGLPPMTLEEVDESGD